MAAMLLSGSIASAQNIEPTIMTIDGQPVSRSEFEYSYNKNNSNGVIDKKTVNEYVDLFVNYKLKVLAAKEAKSDTLASFKKEFASYRECRKSYDGMRNYAENHPDKRRNGRRKTFL